jgi:hypothetical protein
MIDSPFSNLHASRDFTTFQFSDGKSAESPIWQIRFIRQQDNPTYEARLSLQKTTNSVASTSEPDPTDAIMATLLLIIDIYTERYPTRSIRLPAGSDKRGRQCRRTVSKHLEKLAPYFMIDLDAETKRINFDVGTYEYDIILTRKLIPFTNLTMISTVWNSRSRVFDTLVTVIMDKSVRMQMATPPGTNSTTQNNFTGIYPNEKWSRVK